MKEKYFFFVEIESPLQVVNVPRWCTQHKLKTRQRYDDVHKTQSPEGAMNGLTFKIKTAIKISKNVFC